PQDGVVQGVLGAREPHFQQPARSVHRQHAPRVVVPVGRLGARRRGRGGEAAARQGGPSRARGARPTEGGGGRVTATTEKLRIGEVAELTGTTPRTIRYYEEIGVLPGAVDRVQGKHRWYTPADVDRVREIIRLRDLLGLSLEQLSKLLDAETARAE